MEETRLGDIIDDYCSKCGMITNHSVASLINGDAARVRCRTCYYEHKYRKGKAGTKKKGGGKKAALFDAVLSKIGPPPTTTPDDSDSGGNG